MIERVVHKSKNFQEAEEWEILQQIRLSPEERQEIARTLRIRVYGADSPDVREVRTVKILRSPKLLILSNK